MQNKHSEREHWYVSGIGNIDVSGLTSGYTVVYYYFEKAEKPVTIDRQLYISIGIVRS